MTAICLKHPVIPKKFTTAASATAAFGKNICGRVPRKFERTASFIRRDGPAVVNLAIELICLAIILGELFITLPVPQFLIIFFVREICRHGYHLYYLKKSLNKLESAYIEEFGTDFQ